MSHLPILFKNESQVAGAKGTPSSWSRGFSRAPDPVKKLIGIIQEWEKKFRRGELNSAEDLDVDTTGMTGTTPVPYVHLFDVIAYGERQRTKPKIYNKIIDIARVGIRGIVFKHHTHRSEHRFRGAFRNAADMLKPHTVNPGSPMEAAICEELKLAIKLACSPQYTSGDEYENEALVYALYTYGYQPVGFTRNAGKAAEEAVAEVYAAMDPARKRSFDEYLKGHNKEFLKYVKNVVKKAKAVRIGPEQSSSLPAIELT